MAQNRSRSFPWLLIVLGIFLIGTGVLWAILNQPRSPIVTATPASVEQVTRVSLEDALAAYKGGKAVFVDVRSNSSYTASHVTGALSIPLDELPNRLGELDPKSWIITYCT